MLFELIFASVYCIHLYIVLFPFMHDSLECGTSCKCDYFSCGDQHTMPCLLVSYRNRWNSIYRLWMPFVFIYRLLITHTHTTGWWLFIIIFIEMYGKHIKPENGNYHVHKGVVLGCETLVPCNLLQFSRWYICTLLKGLTTPMYSHVLKTPSNMNGKMCVMMWM